LGELRYRDLRRYPVAHPEPDRNRKEVRVLSPGKLQRETTPGGHDDEDPRQIHPAEGPGASLQPRPAAALPRAQVLRLGMPRIADQTDPMSSTLAQASLEPLEKGRVGRLRPI